MKIGIIVPNGFTDLDFYLPWDLLNRVRLLNLHKEWQVEILSDLSEVTSAAGLKLDSTQPFEYANSCDAVFFCSGSETRKLIQDPSFLSKFRLDESRQVIAAIDSGALVLGALGLLKGKQAVTYPTATELLKSYCEVVQKPFVESGRVATGARCLSGDKLALWIIEKLTDAETAEKVYESVKPLE
ncbi:DJ-1/PfpI family protein [Bdellovibrio bacteriovorus]|uniref:DJ-1/PfpI family protein n=1 Tax=Bdellovibrio bacteriovorus TaxID=959 RepID=UPI00045BF44F|nr:DJ-1/PfpI family protein [Bdellovibrio bacteriovorus]AHZ84307.1 hypothetical protein EP01_05070 [Bdellovibrio bacteriovorus]BEV68195.1 Isonitrile hydratase [Bdellovibrio bacteriovorus]